MIDEKNVVVSLKWDRKKKGNFYIKCTLKFTAIFS